MDRGWPAQEARRAPHGMIASVNPLASAAGLRVLRDGGNAMDAAIAAGAVLTLVADAITYAEAGFPLTARQARNNAAMAVIAAEFPDTRAVFFPDGRPPAAGFRFRQPDLARTLRTIQAEGAAAFYRGSIARAIVAASDRGGGLFAERDLAEHRTDILDPIQATYRRWPVLAQPPVSP